MKRITLLLSIVIIFSITSLSQGAIKRSTKAIIQFDNKEIAFKTFIEVFVNNGYVLNKTDKEIGLITTESNSQKGVQTKFNVYIKEDGTATLTGLMRIGTIRVMAVEDDSWHKIENKGMKGSAFKKAWLMLETIAKETREQFKFE